MLFLKTSVLLKDLVLSLSINFLFCIHRCVCVYKNLNGPAVLSGSAYKHMWYVELVTIVVVMVACDALRPIFSCFVSFA